MKTILIIAFLVSFFWIDSLAQKIDTIKLKVAGYRELKDCFIINTFNQKTSDSVFIISVKATLIFKCNYEKIIIGKEYNFECKENNLKPIVPYPIALKVKNTFVWKGGDDPKKIPIFSTNAKGLYIHKIKPR